MPPPVPDLVRISKLDTQFHLNPEYTQHVHYISEATLRTRKVPKEERWKREKKLGRGSFGTVWLERCTKGDIEGKLRAVKQVQKVGSSNYHRELEAMALFSHNKFEQCFVKSFGWYDDTESIFITMEYLPDGDLHECLGSPLQEREGQNVVSQILEGLDFMHHNGFAHRDLKPANILVVCRGPDWWIKIADFGISKRATEGLTALRTLTGTPAFTAPEVLGFIQSDDRSEDAYTNAVDIWSLGVVAFLILTGETLFKNQRRLGQYVTGSFIFPSHTLFAYQVSEKGCEFVRGLMAPKPEDRPGAKESLQHPWLSGLTGPAPFETQRSIASTSLRPTPSYYLDPETSASWSTHDTISPYRPDTSTGTPAEETTLTSNAVTSLSTSAQAIQIEWEVGITLKGHTGPVKAVAFSPDGKLVASASGDKTVRLWEVATGTARHTLKGHTDSIRAVAFSPDGILVASTSWDKTVMLWDVATGTARHILKGHTNIVDAVAFSPDGILVASASGDKTVRLWEVATGTARHTLKGHTADVNAVVFSSDGNLVASASDDLTVRLWDAAARSGMSNTFTKITRMLFW